MVRRSSATLALLVSIVITFLASSAAPTPLYATYGAEWGFGSLGTTVAFGVYAIAVLVALLVLGRLSDHLGRRPVLLAGIGGQIVSLVVLTTAAGYPALLAGRVLQGIATGAAVGAVGAAMLDVDRVRGAVANGTAPGAGTAIGALLSGVVVQFLPAPVHTIYYLVIALLLVQAVGVWRMPETSARLPGAAQRARASLVPEIRLPRAVRPRMLVAAPVVFAVWALAGLYGSLAPTLVHQLGGRGVLLGALALSTLAGVAAAAGLVLRDQTPRALMLVAIAALVTGVAGTLASVQQGWLLGFFVGSFVAGIGFGTGFQGAVRSVVGAAEPHERAGVLSALYVVAYLGMGVPAVVAGALVGRVGDVTTVVRGYGVVLIVLALGALVGLVRREPVPATCPQVEAVRA
ncbi:MFS transporter [Cellulomonas sp. PhB150]|uniref:MFS transporter n=1 Tax=Cellulomonas sp. PhB150 TaxID=2485188 RepID=UPI000F46136B|nr:MFS transporter [Cellulomonas sp. PhB150]ROS23609.1 putative MFS family arabinose efflux permease [Cellulomonas sp. PhB150]